jgi:hypothetical protein
MAGGHATLACNACHKTETGDFPAGRGTAVRYAVEATCVSCHRDAHRGALGQACETCHTPAAWRTVSRAFHKVSVFPLEGRHLLVECASCHRNGAIKGTPTTCYDCHWIRRQDDPYEMRLGANCEGCHRPTAWTAVTWEHSARTGVALSPVHKALGCDGCHRSRTFMPGMVTCAACHMAQYQRTGQPNHAAAGFPLQCELCHRASHMTWSMAAFNHDASFPLQGTHAVQACTACHTNNVYRGTPRDCYGCHRPDYERTQNPNHAAAGFPTTCDACHRASDSNWRTSFDHNAFFVLAGRHLTAPCSSCHKNNVYKGTPRECYPCHQTQYDGTSSPNHRAAGFPTTCEICHLASDSSWNQGRFNHTWFPITSGKHAGIDCSVCHIDRNNYRVFSCTTGCHDRSKTDSKHSKVSGYRYDSAACYACHPTGKED